MYNGIGLSSVRGTATSGYVHTNRGHVRSDRRRRVTQRHTTSSNSAKSKYNPISASAREKGNTELQLHERKRQLENELYVLREELEDEGKLSSDDIEAKMNEEVRLFVLINPNNPTGAVVGQDDVDKLLEILQRWPKCILVADEIYDGLDFSNNQVSAASRTNSTPVVVLNGVSKVYYAPGWRIGYMAIHDPTSVLGSVRDGIERILRSRLCASTPAQLGFLAGLQQDRSWMKQYSDTVKERRDVCLSRIAEIEGLEVEAPEGAFYMFVRLTDERWKNNDKQFVLQLLHEEHVLLFMVLALAERKEKDT